MGAGGIARTAPHTPSRVNVNVNAAGAQALAEPTPARTKSVPGALRAAPLMDIVRFRGPTGPLKPSFVPRYTR